MILVDKEIKKLGNKIIDKFSLDNVGAISYDLTLDFVVGYEKSETVTITPSSTMIIRTSEKLKMPNNILGRIAEKNSVMRMGLFVRGPHYQPGHETYCFLFVKNISTNEITLKKGMKIAQIIFEELKEIPEVAYNENKNASFNNEINYKGFSNYEEEYNTYIKKISVLRENLSEKETQIYSNILVFMGIFVSIFSLITINFDTIAKINLDLKTLVILNISLVTVLLIFMSLILFVINKKKYKYDRVAFFILTIVLIIINLIILSFQI